MKRLSPLVLLVLLLPAGCSGKKPPPDPVPIKGEVIGLNGRKLVLTFHAQDETNKKGKVPSPVVDPKTGKFSAVAVPGRYKVTAAPIVLGAGGGPAGGEGGGATGAPGAPKLPPSVLDPQLSPWEVTVPPEGHETIDLKMPAK